MRFDVLQGLRGLFSRPAPKRLEFLAYPEQIPPDQPLYFVGEGKMGRWCLDLLRSRGYTPTLLADNSRGSLPQDAALVVASVQRDAIVAHFRGRADIYQANELYEFVNVFAPQNSVLVDDLSMTYDRITPQQAAHYGKIWR